MSADNTILMLINSTMKRKNILLVLMLALMAPVSAWAQTTYSWGSSSTNSGGATYANPFGRLFGWEYRVSLSA